MYYVVDQSNPKEPMEYIRVTSEDIDKLKEVQIIKFIGKHNSKNLFFFKFYGKHGKYKK